MATDEKINKVKIRTARVYIEKYTKSTHAILLFDDAIESAKKEGIQMERERIREICRLRYNKGIDKDSDMEQFIKKLDIWDDVE